MTIYKVFYKNYELKRGELIGVLIERRKDLRGLTQVEAGLKWAKLTFGQRVKDRHAVFVVPGELKSDLDLLLDKVVFTREEFLGMSKQMS
jgi:hypothetical protein